MKLAEPWLEAMWPFVRDQLPAPGARVLEVGCGPRGGFVPMLLHEGYDAVGVDPEAPQGEAYHQTGFESYDPPTPVDVVVASTSLHHVDDLAEVLDGVAAALVRGGTLVVVEWAWERFDLPTARWCFDRLPTPGPDDEAGWLRHHWEHWQASEQPWDAYLRAWTGEARLHDSGAILQGLDARFERRTCRYVPYCFHELADTTMTDEQAAIDTNRIQATGVQYVATRR